jgi:hypothetical protein
VTPLTDLGSAQYLGFTGGLYPNEKNSPPSAYEAAGVALGATVQPVDRGGNPSGSGKIGMVCIGMSNASSEFSEFIRLAEADVRKNPGLAMVDGALQGASATQMAVPGSGYWKHVDRQLERFEITATQVQTVWLKPAQGYETPGFPEKARILQRALRSIVEILGTKFPQLKLIYVSSRIYGGYSKIDLNPEPIAYETAFAVKWLIEECISHSSPQGALPWVSWGPYLWADGMTPRSDGLIWEPGDFEKDGVHPSAQGALKVATKLLQFFEGDPSTRPWFISQPG